MAGRTVLFCRDAQTKCGVNRNGVLNACYCRGLARLADTPTLEREGLWALDSSVRKSTFYANWADRVQFPDPT